MTAATSRIIQRALSAVGPWTTVGTVTPAATTYQDTGLTNGTEYFYRVIGVNAEGNSAPSNVASATPDALDGVLFAFVQWDSVATLGGLQAYEFDGTNISETGELNYFENEQFSSACQLGTDQIALVDSVTDELRTLQFDGSYWFRVGNALSITLGNNTEIERLTDTRIVRLRRDTFNDLRAIDFDGTDWSGVGTALAVPGGAALSTIAALNSTQLCFVNYGSPGWIRTYEFDGSTFTQVGNSLAETETSGEYDSCALDGNTVVVVGDSEMRVYTWDGTDWTREYTLTGAFTGNDIRCCHDTGGRFLVGHDDWGTAGQFRVYEWDGSAISQVGNSFARGLTSDFTLARVASSDPVSPVVSSQNTTQTSASSAWTHSYSYVSGADIVLIAVHTASPLVSAITVDGETPTLITEVQATSQFPQQFVYAMLASDLSGSPFDVSVTLGDNGFGSSGTGGTSVTFVGGVAPSVLSDLTTIDSNSTHSTSSALSFSLAVTVAAGDYLFFNPVTYRDPATGLRPSGDDRDVLLYKEIFQSPRTMGASFARRTSAGGSEEMSWDNASGSQGFAFSVLAVELS